MVLQAWGWWFLNFDLPLRHHGAPHTALCTMAQLMATQSPLPSTFSLPPPTLVSPKVIPWPAQALQEGCAGDQPLFAGTAHAHMTLEWVFHRLVRC